MCGPFLTGSFWWIFPLVGMLMCLGLFIFLSRFARSGESFMCMRPPHWRAGRPGPETGG